MKLPRISIKDSDHKVVHEAYVRSLEKRFDELVVKLDLTRAALELIAAPKRPDGTYNRCREACELLAKEALENSVP